MNEAETRAEHIDPALKAAGWGSPEIADYVLVYRNIKLAVTEAKAWDKAVTEGVAQAKAYGKKMQIRFSFSTNGQGI